MDANSQKFKSATGDIRDLAHTAAVGIDDGQDGTIWLKRGSKGDLKAKIDFRAPKERTIVIDGETVQIFYPKMSMVQVYDVGKKRVLIDQFFLLGFGGTGKELANAYDITALPAETISNEPATHLQLIPKSADVLKNIRKVELWLSDKTGYPVQQKLFLPSGDYHQVTYANLKVNPSIPDSSLKLKLPKGVQIQRSQQ